MQPDNVLRVVPLPTPPAAHSETNPHPSRSHVGPFRIEAWPLARSAFVIGAARPILGDHGRPTPAHSVRLGHPILRTGLLERTTSTSRHHAPGAPGRRSRRLPSEGEPGQTLDARLRVGPDFDAIPGRWHLSG